MKTIRPGHDGGNPTRGERDGDGGDATGEGEGGGLSFLGDGEGGGLSCVAVLRHSSGLMHSSPDSTYPTGHWHRATQLSVQKSGLGSSQVAGHAVPHSLNVFRPLHVGAGAGEGGGLSWVAVRHSSGLMHSPASST